jgi:hypothetical protein
MKNTIQKVINSSIPALLLLIASPHAVAAELSASSKESSDEIKVLVERGAAVDLILDKCGKHLAAFKNQADVCQYLNNSINRQKEMDGISQLLKVNKLEECSEQCKEILSRREEFNRRTQPMAADTSADMQAFKQWLNQSYPEKPKPKPTAADSIEEIYRQSLTKKDTENEGNFYKKIADLCEKQLIDKIKKLPISKIKSEELASIYFSPVSLEVNEFLFGQKFPKKNSNVIFMGDVIRNDGRRAILSAAGTDFILRHSGQCPLREGWVRDGYGKYLGEETFTTVLGARRTLPAIQLLWCNISEE